MRRLLVFIIVADIFSYTIALKCMRPTDARYFTATNPQFWRDRLWHTGLRLSTGTNETENFFRASQNRGVVFTGQGTPVWWLPINNQETAHFIFTGDEQQILCAQSDLGLRVNWFENIADHRDQVWCQWVVEESPFNANQFKMKNLALQQQMPEIGYVYFGETGLYFDYDNNAINDPRNKVLESSKTFYWVRTNPSQLEFSDLPDRCEFDSSAFYNQGSGSDITMRGATGRRKRRAKNLVFKNKFAQCSQGWFLFKDKCYRIFRFSNVNFARNVKLCKYFKATPVIPSHYGQNSPNATYWLGVKRSSDSNYFHDLEGNRLKYRRWYKGAASFVGDMCTYLKNTTWRSGSCDASHRIMCEARATIKKRERCGKIQIKSVDSKMKSESRYNVRRGGDGRVVGGKIADDGQFPWQVSFRFKEPLELRGLTIYHNCGGTLIDNCWVLTAAHCFPEKDPTKFKVRLGDFNNEIDEGIEQEFDIDLLIIHSEYTFIPSARNDIALVRLKGKRGKCAKLNTNVQPACLPDKSFPIMEEGEKCQVSGWGVTNTTVGQASASANLMWVTLPTLTNEYCKSKYNRRRYGRRGSEIFVDDVMLCAGVKEGGHDACTGDSGGPFVCRNRKGKYGIVGIVSFGIGCARSKYPGVYTNVRHYLPWISAKIHSNGGGNFVRTN